MRSDFFLWALRKAMRFSSRVYRPLSPRWFYRIAFKERLKIHDVVLEGIDDRSGIAAAWVSVD
jgi:hypothetical protein